jgi:thymidine kinase
VNCFYSFAARGGKYKMFRDNGEIEHTNNGWIEVICGPMFSGKTEELIRRLKRAKIAKQRVEIFKPMIDTRYDEEQVVSHDANSIHSTPVESSSNIELLASDTQVVGIDEAQFFDDGIVDVCNKLANQGIRVIVAGLDLDYTGKPFGPMPNLLCTAEHVTKLHAICTRSGKLAHFSYRKTEEEKRIMLGELEDYEPVNRAVFVRLMQEKKKNG